MRTDRYARSDATVMLALMLSSCLTRSGISRATVCLTGSLGGRVYRKTALQNTLLVNADSF